MNPFHWFRWRTGHRLHTHYESVLGTTLEVQLVADREATAVHAEHQLLQEIDRLARIFNAYDLDSEFSRWQQTTGTQSVSPELAYLLAEAECWRQRTNGVFHPGVEVATRLWKNHERLNFPPANDVLSPLLAKLDKPLWYVDQAMNTAENLTSLPCTLNSIAKGYIIDCATQTAGSIDGVTAVVVNIGGDIRQSGNRPVLVAITDPFHVAENTPPASTIAIQNAGVATSGNYRRGFRIDERWYSHLIDPRTCRPTEHVLSASIFAPSAMEADVFATVVSILTPDESRAFVADYPNVGILLITDEGEYIANDTWKRHDVSALEKR